MKNKYMITINFINYSCANNLVAALSSSLSLLMSVKASGHPADELTIAYKTGMGAAQS
jgi:hypothetical protein